MGKGKHSCEALLLLLAQMPKQMEGQGSSAETLQIVSASGVKGIADIAEMARLIGSTLPGAAKATNFSHSAPQTET